MSKNRSVLINMRAIPILIATGLLLSCSKADDRLKAKRELIHAAHSYTIPLAHPSATLESAVQRFLETASEGKSIEMNPYIMPQEEYLKAFWGNMPEERVLKGPSVRTAWDIQRQFRSVAYPSLAGDLLGKRILSVEPIVAGVIEGTGIKAHYLSLLRIRTDKGIVETEFVQIIVERHGEFKVAGMTLLRD